jgi:hypothetical protein
MSGGQVTSKGETSAFEDGFEIVEGCDAIVYAGDDAESAVKVDSPTDATYAKYVKIVPAPSHVSVTSKRSRVSFVADGRLVGIILYRPSQTELTVIPKVPAKEGYVGTWETYTLNGKNMVVRAVYTKE